MGKGRGKRSVARSFNKRGLILCEGETEENYFKGLISQEKYRRKFSSINVEIFKPKDHSPIGLIKHAKKLIKQAKRDRNELFKSAGKKKQDNHPEQLLSNKFMDQKPDYIHNESRRSKNGRRTGALLAF